MKSILLVEDESELQKIISFVLEREGFAVRTAPSAEEALSVYQSRQPDLIISDPQFGGMGSLEFMRQVRLLGDTRRIPLIFLTGTNEDWSQKKAEALGAAACIAKPFHVNDLVRTIKDVVPSPE